MSDEPKDDAQPRAERGDRGDPIEQNRADDQAADRCDERHAQNRASFLATLLAVLRVLGLHLRLRCVRGGRDGDFARLRVRRRRSTGSV